MNYLPKLNPTELLKTVLPASYRIIQGKPKKLSDHISISQTILIDAVEKKKDYATDVKTLYDKNIPMKIIAGILGISDSYGYKLLKLFKDD